MSSDKKNYHKGFNFVKTTFLIDSRHSWGMDSAIPQYSFCMNARQEANIGAEVLGWPGSVLCFFFNISEASNITHT